MSFRLVLDILGAGVIFWAIGRILHHLSLKRFDAGYNYGKTKLLYYSALIFYILGNVSSIIIGGIDGICHKRLYILHQHELYEVKDICRNQNLSYDERESALSEYITGPYMQYPLDIPFTWYWYVL